LKGITDFKENFFVKTIKMIKKYNQMYLWHSGALPITFPMNPKTCCGNLESVRGWNKELSGWLG
jgi:hypothetical protein